MHEADLYGSDLDYGTRTYMILNPLFENFKGFIDYYLTNNVEFEVRLLADELETYRKLNDFGKDKKAKVVEKSSAKIKRVLEKGETTQD